MNNEVSSARVHAFPISRNRPFVLATGMAAARWRDISRCVEWQETRVFCRQITLQDAGVPHAEIVRELAAMRGALARVREAHHAFRYGENAADTQSGVDPTAA
jgi:hypothetical protein